jgi:acetyl esterase/lipase
MSRRAGMFWSFMVILVGLALLAGLAAAFPLSTINALTPSGTYRKQADLAYGDNPRQRLDVYVPADAGQDIAGSPGKPVVVFFYGGSWNSGDRADYAFVGEALAARGMVTVIADYRLYPEVRYPDFLDDSGRAVAWALREIGKFGGDPGRLFIMGHSAGAYNAAMVALDRRWLADTGEPDRATQRIRGLIGLAGPYDFLPIENPAVKPVFFHPDTPPESQPVRHVTPSAPPALLIAPRNDRLVDPQRNTGSLAQGLREANVPVKEIYFDRVNHITLVGTFAWPLRSLAPTIDMIDEFVHSAAH